MSIIIWVFLGSILIVLLLVISRQSTEKPQRRRIKVEDTRLGWEGVRETDLRLTYKRFKELYPYARITYTEYKQLQREKAFKRAVSSQTIKRMVR
jgi:hypothetical protein